VDQTDFWPLGTSPGANTPPGPRLRRPVGDARVSCVSDIFYRCNTLPRETPLRSFFVGLWRRWSNLFPPFDLEPLCLPVLVFPFGFTFSGLTLARVFRPSPLAVRNLRSTSSPSVVKGFLSILHGSITFPGWGRAFFSPVLTSGHRP